MDSKGDGMKCYAESDKKTRRWFLNQWKVWPERVDDACTTNGAFHYGGLLAYRAVHGAKLPEMSPEFARHVEMMDSFTHD